MTNIDHRPLFDTAKVEQIYTEKDGVAVKYVCTTALDTGVNPVDVFYRETPHPEFGNRYFGLYRNMYAAGTQIMITNADRIENLEFDMVDVNGTLHYSRDRHDYYTVGDVSIDGGRAYMKRAGNLSYPVVTLKVKDGEFVNAD
jgi:hypothetical protein